MVPPPAGSPEPDTESVRRLWDAKASDWAAQSDTLAAMADRYNLPLLEASRLVAGDVVLDLASGVGEPAFTESRMVGPDGMVIATDLSIAMVQALQQRDFHRRLALAAADMQQLPFRDTCFDRVICRFGIMFVPEPVQALRAVHRVLKPGGRAAFMVWGEQQDQTIFTLLSDAVHAILGFPPDHHHLQIFRFGRCGALAELFRMADFIDIAEESRTFTPLAPLDAPFWHPPLAMTFGHLLDGIAPADRAALDADILKRLAPLREASGYRLHAKLHIVSGSRAT